MTSPDYFEEWGRENIEKIFAHFDGGVLHIHVNGRHLFESIRSIRGLKAVFLGDDAGYPPAFKVLDTIKNTLGDIPVMAMAEYQDFCDKLENHKIPGGGILPDYEYAGCRFREPSDG